MGELFQRIYESSRHPQALEAHAALEKPDADPGLAKLYRVFHGPIATTLDNRREPFLAVEAEAPGKNVYPWRIGADEVELFLTSHPEARAELLGERTVVRRATSANLARDRAAIDRHPVLAALHPEPAGSAARAGGGARRVGALRGAVFGGLGRRAGDRAARSLPRRRPDRARGPRVRALSEKPGPRPALRRLRERRRRLGHRPLRTAQRPDRRLRDLRRRAVRRQDVPRLEPPAARRGGDRRAREVARRPAGGRRRPALRAAQAGARRHSGRRLPGDRGLRPGARRQHRHHPAQRRALLAPLRPHHPAAREPDDAPRAGRDRPAPVARRGRARARRRARRRGEFPARPLARDRSLPRPRPHPRRPRHSTRRSSTGPTRSRR